MIAPPVTFALPTPDATAQFARRLGQNLAAGDTVLLDGQIGAGKTHLCRHLIQSLVDLPEDVPSPTFTLVQTYETAAGEIWHADLYRLGDVTEVAELGLADAFDKGICLVEWPDRLGPAAPGTALSLNLTPDEALDEQRWITLNWQHPKWAQKLEFLTDA